ncbi:MAG: N-acyl-D-amino-acid deacylase family protein, partial [bacterium]
MADLLIQGGTVVDGSGEAAFEADVRVQGRRIVEIGPALAAREGERTLDARGAIVAPGFIDIHTHLDPTLFWDPLCDPMPQHGVTTVLTGNCSLSLVPVCDAHREEAIGVFSDIEDIPVSTMRDHLPWSWESYAEYRDAQGGEGLGVHVAALIGHSTLRIHALGAEAWERASTPAERDRLVSVLEESMAEGCFGLSTSFFDTDRHARPVPSRRADDPELEALVDVIHRNGAGLVEFIPNQSTEDPRRDLDRMAALVGPRNVTATWNGLVVSRMSPESCRLLAEHAERQRVEGLPIFAQFSPRTLDMMVTWEQSLIFVMHPEGWNVFMSEDDPDRRRAMLSDPEWRRIAREEWDAIPMSIFPIHHPEKALFISVAHPELEPWVGRSLGDLAAERSLHPSDALADWLLENDLSPGVVAVGVANDEVEEVGRMLRNPATIVGASDAGAHLQMMCAAGDTTLFLTRHVRDRGDFTLEEGIFELTGRLADCFGFHQRGRIL